MDSNKSSLKWVVWVIIIIALVALILYIRPIIDLMRSKAGPGPSLSVTPSSLTVQTGQSVAVDVMLDTTGLNVDGVDIVSLRFNPSVLQVVDDNAGVAGVQATPGGLFPNTLVNSADNTTGIFMFSQLAAGGTQYNGSGKLVTLNFKSIAAGTSPITIDFVPGKTDDSNVAGAGVDALLLVANATVAVADPVPTPVPTPTPEPTPAPAPSPSPTPTPIAKFKVGDNVVTTAKVNVRKAAGGGSVGKQALGAVGVVAGGPQTVSTTIWWNINFTTGADGWVAEPYLKIK
jgi:hypothetical protein